MDKSKSLGCEVTARLTTIELVANANPGNDAVIEAAIEATYQRIRKPFYAHAGYIDRSKLERERRKTRRHKYQFERE